MVIFKSGVNQKEINKFLLDYLDEGSLEKGFWPRPGIGPLLQATVAGHDGYAIYFTGAATPKQRQLIKKDILTSPVVLRVFENTAPNEARLE
ncbi:MAG TPA: hypothetical protein VOA87_06705 [Thermoanaerobaculia bacterium]|nr:hypothetical protein [Thermoanaerobaculia bacterium]